MNGHLAFVDASALRTIKNIERLIEASIKLQGASSLRNHFALLDLDCDGSLLVRQQHAGCKDKITQITGQKQHQGQPYDAQKSLATALPTLYHITQGNGLNILLAAEESIGAPKLHNLQHGWKLHTKQLHRLGGDDETADCVSVLTKLPSSPEGIKTFLQLSADVDGADDQLPDPEADEQAYTTAVYQRCQQLLGEWLAFFRHRNIRLLLLATGYDEMEASKAQTLLAYSLHLLLLTACPAGSCVCPITSSESSDGDTWELDRSWPRNVLKQVLQAAGQTCRLDELRAKVQALKLAKDADGDKWVQLQYETFQWRTVKPSTAGAKPRENAAAAAASRQAKPTASGAGSVGAAPEAAAAADNGEARKRMRRTAAERAAAGGGGPPPRQPLKAAQQNQQQLQQPANSASVGCPAGSHAGGSRRSDSQPVGGIRAVVSHAARRLMAASDQPQQSKQQRKTGGAGLVAERALGLGTTRSRIGRDSSGLLQPAQLGGSQEPNSSAFTGASSRQLQRLGSQRELIPPITCAAAAADVDVGTDTAPPEAEGGVAPEPAAAATQVSDQEVHTTIEVKDSEHQPALQHKQQHHKPSSGGTGCLVAANLVGSAAADIAIAAVKSELERLLAGRKRSGSLRSKHVQTLKEDLARLCDVAVKALVQQCPEDQQQWAYGISAAAKEAVLYAKQELDRMKDSSLKKLAHQLDGVGDPSPDATAAAKTAGLPTPDEAAIRRARLRQGLLVLTGRDGYLYKRIPGVHIPEVVLQPAFWTLFCLHSVLVVGPLVDHPTPPPDMENDGVRWSAKIQYVSAERHIDWFLENIDGGWSLWATRIRNNQQQQQQEAAASTIKPAPGGDHQEEQGSQEPLLLFGAYADAYEWFTAVVLPGLESQDWLVGLFLLLSRWRRGHRVEEGSMQVPRVVDLDSQHQLGDPTLLGAAMLEDIRRQQEQQRKELRRALRNYEKGEALRKKREAQGAGEGVGMTEGVQSDAVTAAAAAAGGAGRSDKKRRNDDEADCSGGSATKATKRRCPGIEASSKSAAAGRPSRVNPAMLLRRKHAPAVNDPLKAMKNLKGLPGKNKLRLDEARGPKKQQKQKPKHPRDLKEIEDDADSTQHKQKHNSAAAAGGGGGGGGGGDSGPGSGGTTAANAGSGAADAAGSGGQLKPKQPNKFARQKVVKQQPVKEHQDDQNVEAVLADLGIDLGGSSMQPKPPAAPAAAGFATAMAGAAAVPAAGAKRPGIFGIAGLIGGGPKQQQLPRVADPFGFLAPSPTAAAPAATVATVAPAAAAGVQLAAGASSAAAVAEVAAAVAEIAAAVHVPETPGEAVPSADDMQVDAVISDHCPASANAAQQHLSGLDAGQTPLHLEARFAAVVTYAADVGTVHVARVTAVVAGEFQAQRAAEPEQPGQDGCLQAQQPAQHAEQFCVDQEQLIQQDASQKQQQEEQPLAASSRKRKAATFGASGSKQKQSSAARQQQQSEYDSLSPPGRCMTRRKSAEMQAQVAADWLENIAPPSARTRHAGARTPTAVLPSPPTAVEGKKSSKQGGNSRLQQPQQQPEDAAVDKPGAVAAQQQDVSHTGMADTATVELAVAPAAPGVSPDVATVEQQQQQCGSPQYLQPDAAKAAGPALSQQEQLQGEEALVTELHAAVTAAAPDHKEVVPAAAVTPASTGRRATRRTAAAAASSEQLVQEAGVTHDSVAAGAEVTLPAQSAGTTATKRGRSTGRGGSKERLQQQQQQHTLSSLPEKYIIQSAQAAGGRDVPPSARTRHAGSRRPVLWSVEPSQQLAAPQSNALLDAATAAADVVAGSVVGRPRVGRGRSRSKSRNKDQIAPEQNAAAAAVEVIVAGAIDGSAAGDHDAGGDAAVAAAGAGESLGAAAGKSHSGRSTSRQHQPEEATALPGAADCNQAAAADVTAAAPRRSRKVAAEEAAAEPQLAQTPATSRPRRSSTIHQQSQQQHGIQPSTADLHQQQPAADVDTSVGTAGTGSRRQRQQRRHQRRQQQQAGELTPPAAAAAAVGEDSAGQYLLSPVDIDLENGQGEEEQPQGEEHVMQQTAAKNGHGLVLAAAAAAGHLDDTDGGLAAMQIDPVRANDAGPADPAVAPGTTAVAAAAGDPAVSVLPAAGAAAGPTCQTPGTVSALSDSPEVFMAELRSMHEWGRTRERIIPLTTGVRPSTRRMTRQDSGIVSPSQIGLTSRLEAAAAEPSSQIVAAVQGSEAVQGAVEGATSDVDRQQQGQQQDSQQQQQQASGCDQPDQVFGCSKCRKDRNGCCRCNPAKAKGSQRTKSSTQGTLSRTDNSEQQCGQQQQEGQQQQLACSEELLGPSSTSAATAAHSKLQQEVQQHVEGSKVSKKQPKYWNELQSLQEHNRDEFVDTGHNTGRNQRGTRSTSSLK